MLAGKGAPENRPPWVHSGRVPRCSVAGHVRLFPERASSNSQVSRQEQLDTLTTLSSATSQRSAICSHDAVRSAVPKHTCSPTVGSRSPLYGLRVSIVDQPYSLAIDGHNHTKASTGSTPDAGSAPLAHP